MFYSIRGTVSTIFKDAIVLETSEYGYIIYVSNPKYYQINQFYKLLIYQHTHEDYSYLVGFLSEEEKQFFFKLISVRGLGPKSALKIIKYIDIDTFKQTIKNKDIETLCKIPGITKKLGLQIMLELENSLSDGKEANNAFIINTLVKLGYKKSLIVSALNKLDLSDKDETEIIKEVLNLLRG